MKLLVGLAVAVLAATAAAPASAHHAFAVEFDAKACGDVTGILSRVQYENPHAYLYLDVTNAAGEVEEATFQLSSTSNLRRGGATPFVLNSSVGKEVVIRGCASRNGEQHRYAASYIRLADGTVQRLGQDVEGVFGNRIWK